jgi:hypothetical protein
LGSVGKHGYSAQNGDGHWNIFVVYQPIKYTYRKLYHHELQPELQHEQDHKPPGSAMSEGKCKSHKFVGNYIFFHRERDHAAGLTEAH